MQTISEIQREYSEKLQQFKENLDAEEREAIGAVLKSLNLDKEVKRVRDGKIGVLKIVTSYGYGVEVNFYPITKEGKPSKNANGYTWSIEKDYVPYSTTTEEAKE